MDIQAITALVDDEFNQLDQLISESLFSNISLINDISCHLVNNSGKRLRPLLVLLAGKAIQLSPKHITMAAVIEYIHTATLLHDDVVDHSKLRRGKATANDIWGNEAPILVGDFLYSRSFQLMLSLDNNQILRIIADATNNIAEGEVLQLAVKNDPNITKECYFEIITNKTARLFCAATETTALLTNTKNLQSPAKEFGLHLGIAYQIIDDLLDYLPCSDQLGKQLGDDIFEGKVTLPLIYLLEHGSPQQKKLITDSIRLGCRDNFAEIQQAIIHSGAIDYCKQQAKLEVEQAKHQLLAFPRNKYTESLNHLANFISQRLY